MSGCNGKCSSCGPEDCSPQTEYKITYSKKPIKIDMAEFMKPLPKQKEDGSGLENKCPHYEYGTMQRYQCEHCIREWVQVYSDSEVEYKATELKAKGKKIASQRVTEALKDKKLKRNVT